MFTGLVLAATAGAIANTGVFLQKLALDSRRPGQSMFAAFLMRPWIAGAVLLQLSWFAQIAALKFAPLYFVQPIGSVGIAVLVVLARARLHEPVTAKLAISIAIVIGGASLLALSSFRSTLASTTVTTVPIDTLLILGVTALGIGGYAQIAKTLKVIGQAVAAGILFGSAVALSKPIAGQIGALEPGFVVDVLSHKELYLVGIASTLGFFFNQAALASGRASVVAPVILSIMTAVPVGFGLIIFGEPLPPYPARAALAIGGTACVVGVALLARMDAEAEPKKRPDSFSYGAARASGIEVTGRSPTKDATDRVPSSTAERG